MASAGASFKRYITICIYFVVCENYARSTDAAMSLGRMADTVGDNKSSTTPLSTYSPKNICHTLLEEEKSQKGWFMRERKGERHYISEFCGGLLQTKWASSFECNYGECAVTAAAPAAGVVDSVIALVYSCRHQFGVRPPSALFFLKIQLIKYDYDFVWQAVSSHPI